MDFQEKWIYKHQLMLQISFGKIAISYLKSDLDINSTFFYIQALLVSLANISKMLDSNVTIFKNDKKEKEKKLKISRANAIIKELNVDVSKFQQIMNRSLRNSNEHFDENIDKYIEEIRNSGMGYADCNIGTISKNGETAGFHCPNTIFFRHYDNKNRVVLYINQSISNINELKIDDISIELEQLENACSKW